MRRAVRGDGGSQNRRTLLIIAHRIDTIMDCQSIAGKDTPLSPCLICHQVCCSVEVNLGMLHIRLLGAALRATVLELHRLGRQLIIKINTRLLIAAAGAVWGSFGGARAPSELTQQPGGTFARLAQAAASDSAMRRTAA